MLGPKDPRLLGHVPCDGRNAQGQRPSTGKEAAAPRNGGNGRQRRSNGGNGRQRRATRSSALDRRTTWKHPSIQGCPAYGPCTTRGARSPCHVHPAPPPVCYRPTVRVRCPPPLSTFQNSERLGGTVDCAPTSVFGCRPYQKSSLFRPLQPAT